MYLAIDVGATKTLMAVFSHDGKLINEQRIKTNPSYKKFLSDVSTVLEQNGFKDIKFAACCCALPGRIDRKEGIGTRFGNLKWKNVTIRHDLQKMLEGTEVFIDNDAKLAALSEALSHKKYRKVLYITLSTGLGGGIIIDGNIDPVFADMEPGKTVLEHEGILMQWEEFASGKALVERFGTTAEKLNNPFAWKSYAKDIAQGLDALLAVLQPDVVIIGGSVGAYLEKFIDPLKEELKKYQNNMVSIPPIIKADKPEEAVIYGCYQLIRRKLA